MYDELVKSIHCCFGFDSMEADCENCIMKDKREEYNYGGCCNELGLAAANTIEELQRLVEANKTFNWIPVTERLPETDDDVVVAFKNSKDGEWWYRIDNFVDGAFCYNAAFGRNITHWMPLPEPPREET